MMHTFYVQHTSDVSFTGFEIIKNKANRRQALQRAYISWRVLSNRRFRSFKPLNIYVKHSMTIIRTLCLLWIAVV